MLQIGVVTAQEPTQVIAVATRNEHTQISDIYTIQLNGENRINLTQHPADDIWPAWSPDGQQLAFSSDRDGDFDIWLMNEDGSNLEKLTDSPIQEIRPVWSPSGEHILYAGHSGDKHSYQEEHNLYILRLQDRTTTQLDFGDLTLTGTSGSWSPDGARIMFAARPHYAPEIIDSDLYILNIGDRRNILPVTRNESSHTAPYWISDFEVVHFQRKELYKRDETRGYYKLNAVTGEKLFLINPFNVFTAIGFEAGTLVMLFDGLDGICYFNTETGAQVFVDNTGPFDDSMSWKPTAPEPVNVEHRFRRGQC